MVRPAKEQTIYTLTMVRPAKAQTIYTLIMVRSAAAQTIYTLTMVRAPAEQTIVTFLPHNFTTLARGNGAATTMPHCASPHIWG